MNLVGITLVYFALPLFVFLATFVNPVVSAVLIATLAASVYIVSSAPRSKKYYSRKEIYIILIFSFIFTYLSGAGNLAFQNSDWLKHNAILHSLMSQPWPVMFTGFQGGAHDLFLNYYLGWYMVPAFIGKISGGLVGIALLGQFVYTFLGVALVFTWLRNFLGKISIFHIVFFTLFATADVAGILALGKTGLLNFVTPIEGWSLPGLLEYSSFITLLFWVPGQAMAGWIMTAFLLKANQNKKYIYATILMLPLAAFWSPFAVLGALPFCLFMISQNIKAIRQSVDRQVSFVIVTSLLLLAFLGLYYLSNLGSAESGGISLTLSHLKNTKELVRFLLFYVFEALVPAAILVFYYLGNRGARQHDEPYVYGHYLVAALILLTLPFFKLGINNDLLMRASIPALFVLYFSTVRYFAKSDFLAQVRNYASSPSNKPYKPYAKSLLFERCEALPHESRTNAHSFSISSRILAGLHSKSKYLLSGLYELDKLHTLIPLFVSLCIILYFLMGTITSLTEISRTVWGNRADFARVGIDQIGTRQMQLQYMGRDIWMMKK